MSGLPRPKEAEANFFSEAINWARSFYMERIVFDMDANAINSAKMNISEFRSLISSRQSIPFTQCKNI